MNIFGPDLQKACSLFSAINVEKCDRVELHWDGLDLTFTQRGDKYAAFLPLAATIACDEPLALAFAGKVFKKFVSALGSYGWELNIRSSLAGAPDPAPLEFVAKRENRTLRLAPTDPNVDAKIPEFDFSDAFELDAEIIFRLAPAASKDDTRDSLNSVFTFVADGARHYAATNGHRVHVITTGLVPAPDCSAADVPTAPHIPLAFVPAIAKAKRLRYAEKHCVIGHATYRSALRVDDDLTLLSSPAPHFPPVGAIVQSTISNVALDATRYELRFDRKSLITQCRDVIKLFAKSKDARMKFTRTNSGELLVSAECIGDGLSLSEMLPGTHEFPPDVATFVCIDAVYLLDALSLLQTDEAVLTYVWEPVPEGMQTPNSPDFHVVSPMLVREPGPFPTSINFPRGVALVMPVRF